MRTLLFYSWKRKRINSCWFYLIILFIIFFSDTTAKPSVDIAYSDSVSIKNETEESLNFSLISKECVDNIFIGQLNALETKTTKVKLLYSSVRCFFNPYRFWEWKISTSSQKEMFLICSSTQSTSPYTWPSADNFLIRCEADPDKNNQGLKSTFTRESIKAANIIIKKI